MASNAHLAFSKNIHLEQESSGESLLFILFCAPAASQLLEAFGNELHDDNGLGKMLVIKIHYCCTVGLRNAAKCRRGLVTLLFPFKLADKVGKFGSFWFPADRLISLQNDTTAIGVAELSKD